MRQSFRIRHLNLVYIPFLQITCYFTILFFLLCRYDYFSSKNIIAVENAILNLALYST